MKLKYIIVGLLTGIALYQGYKKLKYMPDDIDGDSCWFCKII